MVRSSRLPRRPRIEPQSERSDWPQVASELRAAINRALAEAGIQGPQNEVRVVAVARDVPGLPPADGDSREKQAR